MRLLERDRPLGILSQLHDEATRGHGRLVFVEGEAGIGKTMLVDAFLRSLPARTRASTGACDPMATPRPFGPFLDVAWRLDRTLAGLMEDGARPAAIYRAFLSALGREPGTVVVLDDLHWADEATLGLLVHAARRIESTGALLIGTYRDDEVGPEHPLRLVVGDLATAAGVRRLALEPLSIAAVAELASATGLDPIELREHTRGNPFFVSEVIAGAPDRLPPTVRDAVLARVARLSAPGRRTLEAGAVIGQPVDPSLLASVVDGLAAAECLARGLLVADESGYRFRHEVARQAVLSAIDPSRRQALHRRVLEVLEARADAPAAVLAEHAVQARQPEAVLRHAVAAADRASVAGAHREAVAHLASAEPFASRLPPAMRARFYERLAQEQFVTARPDTGLAAFERAAGLWHELSQPVDEVRVLSEAAKSYVATGRNRETAALEARVAALSGDLPDGPAKAEAQNVLAYLRFQDRDPAAIALGRRAVELGGDDPAALPSVVMALNTVGGARVHHGDFRGVEDLERSLDLALRHGLDRNAAHAYTNLSEVLVEQLRFDEAVRRYEAGVTFVVDRELDVQRLYLEAYQALADVERGRWVAADARLEELLGSRLNSVIGRLVATLAAGRLATRRGAPEAQALLDEALALAVPIGTAQRLGPVRAARAELAWLQGDPARAATEAGAALDQAVRADDAWTSGELRWWLRQSGQVTPNALRPAEPWRLQLAGDWREAADAWLAIECPYEAGLALLASGEPSEVEEARQLFDRLGARPGVGLAARRLRELGVRSIPRGARPSTRANPVGLTARELEIASLVVAGLTSDQVAVRLFLSRRTVDHHVAAVLGKLGVRRRGELRAAAHARGIALRPLTETTPS
ncbi:MAG TPA: AAA family ATPase [Candidatus Limnocylindrales bacterium]